MLKVLDVTKTLNGLYKREIYPCIPGFDRATETNRVRLLANYLSATGLTALAYYRRPAVSVYDY